jgi:hypothetical protein
MWTTSSLAAAVVVVMSKVDGSLVAAALAAS